MLLLLGLGSEHLLTFGMGAGELAESDSGPQDASILTLGYGGTGNTGWTLTLGYGPQSEPGPPPPPAAAESARFGGGPFWRRYGYVGYGREEDEEEYPISEQVPAPVAPERVVVALKEQRRRVVQALPSFDAESATRIAYRGLKAELREAFSESRRRLQDEEDEIIAILMLMD